MLNSSFNFTDRLEFVVNASVFVWHLWLWLKLFSDEAHQYIWFRNTEKNKLNYVEHQHAAEDWQDTHKT